MPQMYGVCAVFGTVSRYQRLGIRVVDEDTAHVYWGQRRIKGQCGEF